MRSVATGFLLLSALGLMQCSDKTEDMPKPIDPSTVANYAEVGTQAFQVDSSQTEALLLPYRPEQVLTTQKTDFLVIYLYTKAKAQTIQIGIFDFKMKAGKVAYPVNAPNQLLDRTGISYYNGTTPAYHISTDYAAPDWSIEITGFDPVKKRVKGTFSGTLGKGTKAELRITQGRFNAPYQVR